MIGVRLGDLIEYDGEAWEIVTREKDELVLRHLIDERLRRVSVLTLLADDTFKPEPVDVDTDLARASILASLDTREADRVRFLHKHVYELLNGVQAPEVGQPLPQPRAEYALDRPFGERLDAKVAELAAAGRPLSRRTLQRHVKAYRENGIAGLVDARKQRTSTEHGELDPALVAIIDDVLAQQVGRSTGTRSRAIHDIKARAKLDSERTGITIRVPSDRTLYRALERLDRGRHSFGEASTRRSLANQPDRPWGGAYPQRPGELCEIDSTPFDVMVILPDGSAGRCDLTGVIDVATRTIMATVLVPVATRAVDAAVLLYRAMLPMPMQPGWDASLAYSRSILPHGMLADAYELEQAAAARPMITPDSITIDRGKVFDSEVFRNACQYLQISVTNASPYSPTDKPHIERGFGTIRTRFAQYLNGYIGRSVSTRGDDATTKAYWHMHEVQNLLDQWILTHYQNEPLEGLQHPALPGRNLSPNNMYAALAGVAPPSYSRLDPQQALSLLPVTYSTISRRGIKLNRIYYTAEELHRLAGRQSGLAGRAAGKWEVRYDPYRMSRIWVRDNIDGVWIEARWNVRDRVPEFSLDTLQAAVAALGNPDTPAGKDILEHIYRIQTKGAMTNKERNAARRDLAASPVDPALPGTPAPTMPIPATPPDAEGPPEPAKPVPLFERGR